MRSLSMSLAVLALTGYALAQRGTGPAGPPSATQSPSEAMGSLDFLETCGTCHGRIEQAPPIEILQKLSPEKIYETISTGNMKTQDADLSDKRKIKVDAWLNAKKLETA